MAAIHGPLECLQNRESSATGLGSGRKRCGLRVGVKASV